MLHPEPMTEFGGVPQSPLTGRAPWCLDRLQADTLIATLALLAMLLLSLRSAALHRTQQEQRLPARVGLEGRLAELPLAGKKVLGSRAPTYFLKENLADKARTLTAPWDRAMLSILAAEDKSMDLARELALTGSLPPGSGDAFRQCWRRAYLGEDGNVSAAERDAVFVALGRGYAAHILEARLEARDGHDSARRQKSAEHWATTHLLGLWIVSMVVVLGALGGLIFGGYLVFGKDQETFSKPMPRYQMSGRITLIVLLAWFDVFLLSGSIISLMAGLLSFLNPIILPCSVALHAWVGLMLLTSAEGITIRQLWKKVAPEFQIKHLGLALGYLFLALLLVLIVSWISSLFFKPSETPQKELVEMLSDTEGFIPVTLLFMTVAGLAPFFEELLFRGFILPAFGQRLENMFGKHNAWLLAVLASGLLFGVIHLKPMALPALGTLGIMLGFATLRTGTLWSAILVHALWNAGQFAFMRLLMS